jgi:hypothetical protein
MKTRIVFLCLLFLIAGCGVKKEETASVDVFEKVVDPTALKAVAQNPAQQEMPRDLYSNGKTKLIKTLNYKFEVENINKTAEAIEAAVKKYPAYISDSKMRLENPLLENEITIRVQNEFF